MSPRAALIGEAWLVGCVVPLLLLAHAAALVGLIVAAAELPTPLTNSFVSGYRVAATPDRLQGRVQAAGMLTTMSLAWLGPLIVGFVFQHAGASATVLMVTGWAALLAVITTSVPALRAGPPVEVRATYREAAAASGLPT
jgi:hypothetical protein